jgi:hypothetical protein
MWLPRCDKPGKGSRHHRKRPGGIDGLALSLPSSYPARIAKGKGILQSRFPNSLFIQWEGEIRRLPGCVMCCQASGSVVGMTVPLKAGPHLVELAGKSVQPFLKKSNAAENQEEFFWV